MDSTDLGPAMAESANRDARERVADHERRIKFLEQVIANLHYQLTGVPLDSAIAAPARPTPQQEAERANYYSALGRRPPQRLGA
jgi:hypothetical protein